MQNSRSFVKSITLITLISILIGSGLIMYSAGNSISYTTLEDTKLDANLKGTTESALNNEYTLRFEIDRSQVPILTYNDLTINVTVGQINDVQVSANEEILDHLYDSTTGILRFTTSESEIAISLSTSEVSPSLGAVAKAALYDDKGFAWSLGMDDNMGLKLSVEAMEQYDWKGTFFLTGNIIDDVRDEDWIVDAPYLRSKVESGWSAGNHTWDHYCLADIDEQTIVDGYNRLREIVDASNRPDYRIISFAAPCFIAEYHPIIIEHRDNGAWPVQFNESGDRTPIIVDEDATADILLEGEFRPSAFVFEYDQPLGRGIYLEVQDADGLMNQFDWMAQRHSQNNEHIWHNTLIHGGKEELIQEVTAHLYDNYGPNGTDQVWVAPSDQIYSYLLVRDNSTITLVSSEPPLPTPMPTDTATPTATSTPAATNTIEATASPTGTQEAVGSTEATPVPATETPTNNPTDTSASLDPSNFLPFMVGGE